MKTAACECVDCGASFERPHRRGQTPKRCASCAREQKSTRDRAYYEANRDKIAGRQRAYYEANRDKVSAYAAKYREANRDALAEWRRAYREDNRDKIAERQRAYREDNRDRIAGRQRAHYAANRANIAQQQRAADARRAARTAEEIAADRARLRPEGVKRCRTCREWLTFDSFYDHPARPDGLNPSCRSCIASRSARRAGVAETARCAYCGGPFEHLDHVLALALGGPDEPANLVPACSACNLSKHARPVREWLTGRVVPFSDRLAEALRPIPC